MHKVFRYSAALLVGCGLTAASTYAAESVTHAPLVTAEKQAELTPDQVIERLKAGNERFVKGKRFESDLIKKAQITAKEGQHPAAIVISCIDSRVPPEIVFDQNIGNMFVSRVAANVIDDDQLGGAEFATKVAGAKVLLVMGHDACGAVHGACANVKMGNLTQLLDKVQPAVDEVAKKHDGTRDCDDEDFVDEVAAQNVRNVVQEIPKRSPVLAKLQKEGKLKIIGAMYELKSGKVTFLD